MTYFLFLPLFLDVDGICAHVPKVLDRTTCTTLELRTRKQQ